MAESRGLTNDSENTEDTSLPCAGSRESWNSCDPTYKNTAPLWLIIGLQLVGAAMLVISTMWLCFNRVMNTNQTGIFSIGMAVGTFAIMFIIVLFAGLRCPYAGEGTPSMRAYYKPVVYSIAVFAQFVWLFAQTYTFRGQFTPTQLSQFDQWSTTDILAMPGGEVMMFQWNNVWIAQFVWTMVNGVIALFAFHSAAFRDHSSSDIAGIASAVTKGMRQTAAPRAARAVGDNL